MQGLAHLFLPPQLLISNPLTAQINTHILRRPLLPTTIPTTAVLAQQTALSGLFLTAISLAYLFTYYHGYSEWIRVSIPVRCIVGVLGVIVGVFMPEKMSPLMFVLCVNDAIWGLWAGWMMGRWDAGIVDENDVDGGVAASEKRE